MNTSPATPTNAIQLLRTGGARAFSLVELLVIVVVIAMFAGLTLPALVGSKERTRRTGCVNNLRQVGIGWTMYEDEYGQVMPCHWHGVGYCATINGGWATSPANPWRTYEAYRVWPGTTNLLMGTGCRVDLPDGPWNLGLLFATRLIPTPRIFYCPSGEEMDAKQSYDYYATPPNTWPSVAPSGVPDDKVRTAYNYVPQLRVTQPSGIPGKLVPKIPGLPTRLTDLDLRKSIVTDLVQDYSFLSHRSAGTVVGLNALFPDGRVVFQNARDNLQAFDLSLWRPGTMEYAGNNPSTFRVIMSLWKP